jgi:TP901 family phage tail tape measure protein
MAKRTIASTNISIGANLSGLQRGLKIAQRSLRNFGSQAKRIGSNITSSVTLPFAAAGAAGVKMATDLESSFSKIENLVGITGKALDNFKSSVKGVSAETGKSQQELSEALFTIASAGLRGAEATEVLERSAKASAIGLGDTQQIAQALTGVMQAYSSSGMTAAQATDTLTAIVREGNLEAEALAPTLGRVVGIASQLGVSFEEVGANIATFTRLGVPAEEAVVGLRGIMASFLKPTADAKNALATLGMTAEDLRNQVSEEGLQATLANLMQSFEGNDEALTSVFGNVRALSAVLGTAGAQGETYAAVLDNISNSTGIVDEGFENVSQTSGFKFQKTLNSLRNAGIELGAALLPMVTKIADFITKAINSFRDLSTETKTTILTLTAIVAASGPIMSGIGFIATALGALLSPVGLIIVGIVGAGYAMYKFWDQVRPILVGVINYFIDLYNESTIFRVAIQGVIFAFKALWTIGSAIFGAFTTQLKAIGKILIGAFTFDRSLVQEGLNDIKDVSLDAVQEIVDGIKKDFSEGFDEAFTPKEKIELVTEEGLQQGIDDMIAPMMKAWEKAKSFFTFKGFTPPSTDGDGDGNGTGGNSDPDPNGETEKKLSKLSIAWGQYSTQVKAQSEAMAQAITGMVDNVLAEGIMRLGEGLVTGKASFEDFGVFLLSTFASTAEQLGKLAINVGFAVEGIKKALENLNPVAAIAAGIGLLALAGATRGRMKQIAAGKDQVKLAKGGLAYGETLAVVGDNPNARMDPEVIAPLSKLQSMIGQSGGGAVEVYGRLSGQDILLSTERADRTRSRQRGF